MGNWGGLWWVMGRVKSGEKGEGLMVGERGRVMGGAKGWVMSEEKGEGYGGLRVGFERC